MIAMLLAPGFFGVCMLDEPVAVCRDASPEYGGRQAQGCPTRFDEGRAPRAGASQVAGQAHPFAALAEALLPRVASDHHLGSLAASSLFHFDLGCLATRRRQFGVTPHSYSFVWAHVHEVQ